MLHVDDGGGALSTREGSAATAAAFASLYKRHHRALHRFCLARTGDAALSEDLVQEAFAKAWVHFDRYDPTRPFWPWLASIAARECLNAHRSASYANRCAETLARAGGAEATDATVGVVFERMRRAGLERAMLALPPRQRAALRLFALDSWSYADIASQLSCSVATVTALIARARARLRQSGAASWGALGGVFRSLQLRLGRLSSRMQGAVAAFGPLGGNAGPSGLVNAVAASLVLVAGVGGLMVIGGAAEGRRSTTTAVEGSKSAAVPPVVAPTEPGIGEPSPPSSPRPSEAPPRTPIAGLEHAGAQLVGSILPPPSDSEPDDYAARTVVASPGNDGDDSVFATSPGFPDPIFLASADGGRSWSRTRALGFRGATRLLLPPAYPRDPRIFAVSGMHGVQVSRDGGDTFETVLAFWGLQDAALSPAFNAGHPVMLLFGRGLLLEYHDDTGMVEALRVEHRRDEVVDSAAYGPQYPSDPTMFVVLRQVRGTVSVHRCLRKPLAAALDSVSLGADVECEPAAPAASNFRGPFTHLRVSPVVRPGLLFLETSLGIYVSEDDGRSFRTSYEWSGLDYRDFRMVTAVVPVPSPSGMSAVATLAGVPDRGANLLRTDDAGRSWTPLSIALPGFEPGARTIAVTPAGRLVAAGERGRLACSGDDGRTWAAGCP